MDTKKQAEDIAYWQEQLIEAKKNLDMYPDRFYYVLRRLRRAQGIPKSYKGENNGVLRGNPI